MKKIILLLFCVAISCRNGSSKSKDGSSCSAAEQETGELVVTCEDGTTGVVDKTPVCQLKPDPAGAGILINCPPSSEWLLIRNGVRGRPGEDCEVLKSERNNSYITCDDRGNVTVVKSSGMTEDFGSCNKIGLLFDPLQGLCRGNDQ